MPCGNASGYQFEVWSTKPLAALRRAAVRGSAFA
jgi:hypothetical protein